MPEDKMDDPSDAILPSIKEEELVPWFQSTGYRIVYHKGRYWKEIVRGFYQPLHWMARLTDEQATKPTPFCWGFQASLSEQAAKAANASMPLVMLPNLSTYDIISLKPTRRYHLRKCYKNVQIVRLRGISILREQGYNVYVSSTLRTGYGKIIDKPDYLNGLTAFFDLKKSLVLAGLISGKLGGYVTGYAVDGISYIDRVVLATEALKTNIGSGLIFEFAQASRRSHQIREMVHGLHTPEDKPLMTYKEGIGFVIKQVPAITHMFPLVETFIRRKYPYKYYRLTGHF
jgi:hypothetical protein